MKKIINMLALCLIFSIGATQSSFAATDKDVTITGVGCGADGNCYANVSPAVSQSCNNNRQVRWNGTTSEGKNLTATALTAKASGLTVNVGTIDNNCAGDFPTLNFITVSG
jgi:hypothetical protein